MNNSKRTPDLRWPDGRPYDATERLAWEAGWEACAAALTPPSRVEEAGDGDFLPDDLERALGMVAMHGTEDDRGDVFTEARRAIRRYAAAREEGRREGREEIAALLDARANATDAGWLFNKAEAAAVRASLRGMAKKASALNAPQGREGGQ